MASADILIVQDRVAKFKNTTAGSASAGAGASAVDVLSAAHRWYQAKTSGNDPAAAIQCLSIKSDAACQRSCLHQCDGAEDNIRQRGFRKFPIL